MAPADRPTSSAVVRKLETEIRIAARPCQSVAPSQQVPSSCTRRTTSRVALVVAEADEDLVQDDLVQDLDTGLRAEHRPECARVIATAIDQLRDTGAAEGA